MFNSVQLYYYGKNNFKKKCNRMLCQQQNRYDNKTDMVTKYMLTISWVL